MSLKIENLSKEFYVGGIKRKILSSVNLELNKGDLISITGRSGCGKTTLLNVISGIVSPDSGKIFIKDNRVKYFFDIFTSRLRNREIGFIFQTFNLLNDETVISNVLLPARINKKLNSQIKKRADELLSKLKVYKFKNEKVSILSGGQKQRVAIARALINSPSIILADEPTANLDAKTSYEIFDILNELRKEGASILIITHKKEMHKLSNIVYSMEDGILERIK